MGGQFPVTSSNRGGLCLAVALFAAVFCSCADAPAGPLPAVGRQQNLIVSDVDGTTLGLYAGLSSAYTATGELQSVVLVVSAQGYIVPFLWNGEAAFLNAAYFPKPGCNGAELIPIAAGSSQLAPFPGLAYRSFVTREVRYLPKGEPPSWMRVESRISFSKDGVPTCNDVGEDGTFLVSHAAGDRTDFVPILNSQPLVLNFTAGNHDSYSDFLPPQLTQSEPGGTLLPQFEQTESAEECSPGCPVDLVGDGGCDLACNYASCSYDGGDCADATESAIEEYESDLCAPGCSFDDIGDGFCDTACNVSACQYDAEDCTK